MKQYTHAWLAFMAIKRLEKTEISERYRKHANSLIKWFKDNRDYVIQGAWYPDAIIKDMSTSHILKYQPAESMGTHKVRELPKEYHLLRIGKSSDVYNKPFCIVKGNLPDRCESISHSIIDNLKMQESEEKGSPICPNDNHVAILFFMLSHYIADAHMPLHCDARNFSEGVGIHAHIEKEWDEEIRAAYKIDEENNRFYYDPEGYPLKVNNCELCDWLENEIVSREFSASWGSNNGNTWDFMSAITQYSYFIAYKMIPENYNESNLDWDGFKSLQTDYSLEDYNKFLLIDAIDSIAKIWLRVWCKYQKWLKIPD